MQQLSIYRFNRALFTSLLLLGVLLSALSLPQSAQATSWYVRDEFRAAVYTNNDGSVTWNSNGTNSNWTEINDDGSAENGRSFHIWFNWMRQYSFQNRSAAFLGGQCGFKLGGKIEQ